MTEVQCFKRIVGAGSNRQEEELGFCIISQIKMGLVNIKLSHQILVDRHYARRNYSKKNPEKKVSTEVFSMWTCFWSTKSRLILLDYFVIIQ